MIMIMTVNHRFAYAAAILSIICNTLIAEAAIGSTAFRDTGSLQKYQSLTGYRIEPLHLSIDQKLTALNLSLRAFGNDIVIKLLQNQDILHPDFTVETDDGTIEQDPESADIVAYFGHVCSINGRSVVTDENTTDSDGFPLGHRNWARILFNHQPSLNAKPLPAFDGSFMINDEIYTVKTVDSYDVTRRKGDVTVKGSHRKSDRIEQPMIIYRESDRSKSNPAASAESSANNGNSSHAGIACGADHAMLDFRMSSKTASNDWAAQLSDFETISGNDRRLSRRAESGCPTATKILYMGVAADCSYVSAYGSSSKALAQIMTDFNLASNLYESTFNVKLGVIKVTLQSNCDTSGGRSWNQQCSSGYSIANRLSDFAEWRGSQTTQAGLWHLMTRCNSGTTVGISYIGTLCKTNVDQAVSGGATAYVSGVGVTSITLNEWVVLSHEIGHNFGARHDCDSTLCATPNALCPRQGCQCNPCGSACDCRGGFLMHPTNDVKSSAFSLGSQQEVCRSLPSIASCLQDPGTKSLITENVCGNGIKEANEQCDCGPADSADCQNNPCCDGATCKLKAGAVCSDTNDLCCSNCQVKRAGTLCRPSRGVCDIEERCDGATGNCPLDGYLPDLQQCSIDGTVDTGRPGQCASGDCTSRELQCKIRGSAAAITGECPGYSNICELYCSTTNTMTCIQISGSYSDGTACGYKGKCDKGVCQMHPFDSIIAWILARLALSITLFSVLALMIGFCIYRCVKVRKLNRKIRQVNRSRSELFLNNQGNGSGEDGGAAPTVRRNFSPSLFLMRKPNNPKTQQPASRPSGSTEWVNPAAYNGNINPEEIDLSQLSRSSTAEQFLIENPVSSVVKTRAVKVSKQRPATLAIETLFSNQKSETGAAAESSKKSVPNAKREADAQGQKPIVDTAVEPAGKDNLDKLLPDLPKSPMLASPTQASPRRPYAFGTGAVIMEDFVTSMVPGAVDPEAFAQQSQQTKAKASSQAKSTRKNSGTAQ